MPTIKQCPTCGSDRIRKVCKDVRRTLHGRLVIVPKVAFYECPACDERVYGPEAMRRIESYGSKRRASA